MSTEKFEEIKQKTLQILEGWLSSCTRRGKISRNTLAVGIVVIDHLMRVCPLPNEEAISEGGEIKGSRSGLGEILRRHGIPDSFLKEVTTRQGHQDGRKLLEKLEWGSKLSEISEEERKSILSECIEHLKKRVNDWLDRQSLKFDLDRQQAPTAWISIILQNAKGRSNGIVEQHLVGAKLARRFKSVSIPNHPAHAADRQTERAGDFDIAKTVYHVTSAPSRDVLKKCANNIRVGLSPVLLVPKDQEGKVCALAQDENIDDKLTIISIEDFLAMNIIELAIDEKKDLFTVFKEIITIYTSRISEVETDLSLKIEIC